VAFSGTDGNCPASDPGPDWTDPLAAGPLAAALVGPAAPLAVAHSPPGADNSLAAAGNLGAGVAQGAGLDSIDPLPAAVQTRDLALPAAPLAGGPRMESCSLDNALPVGRSGPAGDGAASPADCSDLAVGDTGKIPLAPGHPAAPHPNLELDHPQIHRRRPRAPLPVVGAPGPTAGAPPGKVSAGLQPAAAGKRNPAQMGSTAGRPGRPQPDPTRPHGPSLHLRQATVDRGTALLPIIIP